MTGLEIIAEPLARAFATTIAKSGITLVGQGATKLLDGVGELTGEAWRLLSPISQKYIQNYTQRYGIIKLLGMPKPIPLDDIYVNVQLLNPEQLRCFDSVETLEEAFRKSTKRSFQTKKFQKSPGIEIANQEQYLMVLGGSGNWERLLSCVKWDWKPLKERERIIINIWLFLFAWN